MAMCRIGEKMCSAVCWKCIRDTYLKEITKYDGELLECSVCGEEDQNAISIDEIGKRLEPIIQKYFLLGDDMRVFDGPDDEKGSWEQEGEPLSEVVQEVLGQCFDFEDEIVDAVVAAEDIYPPDGDVPFFDNTYCYVPRRIGRSNFRAEWERLLQELKYKRRFFSPTANSLFKKLFGGVEQMSAWDSSAKKQYKSVVRILPEGTKLFRARVVHSHSLLQQIFDDPFKHVGPPPKESARAGRMNPEGVAVLYGARDEETCLAEMRPAIGNDLAVIELKITRPLRVLDFKLLERASSKDSISYFQPDFVAELEKATFRRQLHKLISQPIIPGKESDYLTTQTMAEYLAHVHDEPFDGILFSSVQREDGTNLVLFPRSEEEVGPSFPVSYVDNSVKLFSVKSVTYCHDERKVKVNKGVVNICDKRGDTLDDDWLD